MLPADGILVATRTDRASPPWPASQRPDAFLLYKITRAGVAEVAREESTTVEALAWLDHHTLLVYRETAAHEASLTRVVDGTAAAPTAIPLTAWQLAAPPENAIAHLTITKAGDVWLDRCAQRADPDDWGSACKHPAALRVDTAPFARADAAPAPDPARRIDQLGVGSHLDGATLPTIPAPPNHSLALFPVPPAQQPEGNLHDTRGVRCTSPAGHVEWPGGSDWIETQNVPDFRPTAIAWVRAAPPAYVLTGTATDAIRTRTLTVLFRACEVWPVYDAAFLGGDAWAEMDAPTGPGPGQPNVPDYVHSIWRIAVLGQPVAALVGSQTWFAPQPP